MNFKKIILLLSAPALFCSCGNNEASSLAPTSQSETTVSPFVGNPWGEELAQEIFDTVQCVIPFQEGTIAHTETDIDDYGDPYIAIYLTYDSEESANKAFNDYANTCANSGYIVEIQTLRYIDWETYSYFLYDVAYADLVIGDHLGVEIQTTVSVYDGKDALGIFASNYVHCDKKEYPQAAVDKLLGPNDLPQVIGEGYTYSFMFFIDEGGNQGLEIQVKGASYEIEEKYFYDFQKISPYYQYKADSLDDEYAEQVTEYSEYDDQFYYFGFYDETTIVIYDFDLYNQVFVIDIFLTE